MKENPCGICGSNGSVLSDFLGQKDRGLLPGFVMGSIKNGKKDLKTL